MPSVASFSRFVVGELMWMLRLAVVLVADMGLHLKWMIMTIRLFLYGFILCDKFLAVGAWYIFTPTIVRRIFYRRREMIPGSHNNRAFADVYLPYSVSDLVHGRHNINGDATTASPRPVFICFSGGAWIIASHMWSSGLARLLAESGAIVVCADYRNYPQTGFSGMVLDVEDAIRWVIDHIHFYGGDPNCVSVVAQSAGAHLVALAVANQIEIISRSGTSASTEPHFDPKKLRRIIQVSGIYNLPAVQPMLHRRGLRSDTLQRMATEEDGTVIKLDYFSPYRRLAQISSEMLRCHLPHRIEFVHGDADCTAPCNESRSMAFMLRSKLSSSDNSLIVAPPHDGEGTGDIEEKGKSKSRVALHVVPGGTHTSLIVEDMLHRNSILVDICMGREHSNGGAGLSIRNYVATVLCPF